MSGGCMMVETQAAGLGLVFYPLPPEKGMIL